MTRREYLHLVKGVKAKYEASMNTLNSRYACANSTVKTGDIVGDQVGKILVQNIEAGVSPDRLPECVYIGIMLTCKGTLRKDSKSRVIRQHTRTV